MNCGIYVLPLLQGGDEMRCEGQCCCHPHRRNFALMASAAARNENICPALDVELGHTDCACACGYLHLYNIATSRTASAIRLDCLGYSTEAL